MLSLWQFSIGYALPAVFIAAILWFTHRRKTAGVIFAAGFCVAYWVIYNSAESPSVDVFNWIFYFAIGAAVLAALDAMIAPPIGVGAIVILILLRLAVRALLLKQIPRLISPAMAEMTIDIVSLIGVGWWVTLELLAARTPGVTAPLMLWLISVGAAALLAAFPVVRSAELAGALAVFSFAAAIVAFFKPGLSVARGAVLVVVFLLLAMLVHGYFYSSASDTVDLAGLTPVALVALAPFLAWAGDLPGVRRRSPRMRLAARLIAVGLVIGVAAGLAAKHAMEEKQKQSSAAEYE